MSHKFYQVLESEKYTEVLVNSWEEVFLEENGILKKSEEAFDSPEDLHLFTLQICKDLNQTIGLQSPVISAKWKNYRVHFIYQSLTQDQNILSFRQIKPSPWTLEQLERNGMMAHEERNFLAEAIQQKKNLLVIGSTGSGKTSLINALLQTCNNNERCIVIEDTSEIHLPNSASIKLLTYHDSYQHYKSFQIEDLIKESLRLRPDRLIVGEVRGRETKDLLLALSTGHSGCITSFHAKSSKEAMIRLEMLCQLGAPDWDITAIRKMILFSIDYILLVKKVNGKRILSNIDRIQSLENFGFILESLYSSKHE